MFNFALTKTYQLLLRNLLIITLLTINSFSSAQPQDVMLPIMSSWSIGDHFDFTIDRYTHEVVHSQVIQDKHLTFHSQMRILDASEKSYTILWMYDYDWSAFEGQLSPKYFDNLRKFSKVEIIYKTDQYGTYEQLLNADEINSQFTDMYENLIASLPDTVDMKDVRALAELTNMQHMMSNEEYVEQTFLKDVFLVHYLLGVVLDPKIKNTYVQSFPSLGGQTVFGNAELEVVHINPEQFFCVIEENVTLSEEDSQRFVSSYLQKVGGAQAVQKLNKWDFDIRDQHEFQLFYYPGIPKKITTKRTIAISDSKEFSERTDTTVIQLRIPQE